MTISEKDIRRRYADISGVFTLPPVDYASFRDRLMPPDDSAIPSFTDSIDKRDLEGLYLAVGAERGLPGYIEDIYREYRDLMVRTACRYFPSDASRAEDVVQEIFAGVNWRSFRGTGTLRGWLRTITINRCLDGIRAGKIRTVDIEVANVSDDETPEYTTALEECRNKLFSAVKKALGLITPREKNLLVFNYVEGVGVRDLARTYGVSPATVSRQLKKAREALGREIRALAGDDFSMTDEDIERCLEIML